MQSESCMRRRSVVLGVAIALVLIVVVMVGRDRASVQMHEYLTSNDDASESSQWAMNMDVDDKLQLDGDLEQVSEQVGAKESTMDDAEILSDGAVKQADQVVMDKLGLEADDDNDPVLMDEEEDGEEEGDDVGDSDEEHLQYEADENEKSDSEQEEVSADRVYHRQCRRFRRCYRRFCNKRKCKRVCRRRRVCRRVRSCRRVRYRVRCSYRTSCTFRPYCFTHCSTCRSRCGSVCRVFTRCPPRVRCYNRMCVRRYCARRCVIKGKRCRVYRRCYRRCRGVCGRYRRCANRCYNYRRCHPLNRCYNHCFVRRQVCGRRCHPVTTRRPGTTRRTTRRTTRSTTSRTTRRTTPQTTRRTTRRTTRQTTRRTTRTTTSTTQRTTQRTTRRTTTTTRATTTPPRECPNPRVRKDWHDCTQAERQLYIDGYVALRANGKLAAITREHIEAASSGFDRAVFHGNDGFLPWHRYFIWELERQIQQLGGRFACFALPYWDWSRTAGRTVGSNPMFTQGLGGNGGQGQCVRDNSKFGVASGYRTTAGQCLRRSFQSGTNWYEPTATILRLVESRTTTYGNFRGQLEGWHGMAHVSVGGDLSRTATATDDPIFFLLHGYVDYLWALRSDCHDFTPNTNDNRAFPPGQMTSRMTYPVLSQQTWAYARGRTLVAAMMLGTTNWGYTYHTSNQRARSGMTMANCRFNEVRGAMADAMPEAAMVTDDDEANKLKKDKETAWRACMKVNGNCKSAGSDCSALDKDKNILSGELSPEVKTMRDEMFDFAKQMGDLQNLCEGKYDCTCHKV